MIPRTKKVATMFFEECTVTHEEWLKSLSWQMTLRLGLSEPPCAIAPPHRPQGRGASLLLQRLIVNQYLVKSKWKPTNLYSVYTQCSGGHQSGQHIYKKCSLNVLSSYDKMTTQKK